jgi:RNA polymerase sigma-70 factor (ECF subfamily)
VNDSELVASARKGDPAAFAELIGRYEERILRLVRGMVPAADVEDVAQEAFLKAFRKLHLFDGRSSFYTWIYRLSANTAMDWRKKEARRRHAPLPESPTGEDRTESRDDGPAERAVQHELGELIDRAIAELPPKYHEILVLREFRGLSYDAISEELQISKGTVESRLFRARERLRDRLRPWIET